MNKIEDLKINELIAEGQIFKNYNELCGYLNIDKGNGGDTKKKNIRTLSEWCDFKKQGQKYIIETVYEKRIPTVSNSKYVKHIELLMLNFLANREDKETIIPTKSLLLEFNMCNSRLTKYNGKEVADYKNKFGLYYEFTMNVRSRLKQILESSLNSMQRKRLIYYQKNVPCGVLNKKYSILDTEELAILLDLEQQTFSVLNKRYDLKCKDLFDIDEHGLRGEYYNILNIKARSKLGYDYIFSAYRIVRADRFYLIRELKNLIIENKNELNVKIVDALNLVENYKNTEDFVKIHNEMVEFFVENKIE